MIIKRPGGKHGVVGDVGESLGDVGGVGENRGDVGENLGDVGDVGENLRDVGEDVGDVGRSIGDVKYIIVDFWTIFSTI